MKRLVLVLTGIVLSVAFMESCSADKMTEEAKAVYERAEKALEAKDYDKALALVDSLNKRYPTAFEVREDGIILRNKIALREAQDSLQLADSLLQVCKKGNASASEVAIRQQYFDQLCMKVRFYYKKIDKLNAAKARTESGNE